jgi:hypothetical protein
MSRSHTFFQPRQAAIVPVVVCHADGSGAAMFAGEDNGTTNLGGKSLVLLLKIEDGNLSPENGKALLFDGWAEPARKSRDHAACSRGAWCKIWLPDIGGPSPTKRTFIRATP